MVHGKLSSQQCRPPAASLSAPADGTAFVPARQGCLELQSEQWCVNALEVVKGKADGWGSQTSAGGQNSWAQDAPRDKLEQPGPQAPSLMVASIQASDLGCGGAGASRGKRKFRESPG